MSSFLPPPVRSWREFLAAATAEPSIDDGSSRADPDNDWYGASWREAVQLAIDGWPRALADANVTIGELREHSGLAQDALALDPVWDVAGAEVDIGAYLSGTPECMIDAVPRVTSRRGKVVTFLIPAAYSHDVPHQAIINRGLALATLCTAIIDAGHSVEIWCGDSGWLHGSKARRNGMTDTDPLTRRFCGVARVIEAGEPFDVGRLIFAVAHPAMMRRLWLGFWDAQPRVVARMIKDNAYGFPPYDCTGADLPPEITEPYVFPYLASTDRQWDELPTALSWSRRMFIDLGLVQE